MLGRTAVLATARGGVYDPGTPTEGFDHATPALDIILGATLGMTVEIIATNLTLSRHLSMPDDARERADRELAEAIETARATARRLG